MSAVNVTSAPDDDDGQRLLDFRPGPAGKQQRNKAERRDAGGHQHRPQSPNSPFEHDPLKRQSFVDQLVEVADKNQAVEDCYPQKGYEANRQKQLAQHSRALLKATTT